MSDEQQIIARLDRPLVERAAALQGQSVSDFIVSATREAAEETIVRHSMIELSLADQEKFADALLNPPPIAPALTRAIADSDRLFDRS